jgi:hypothetical protein
MEHTDRTALDPAEHRDLAYQDPIALGDHLFHRGD